MKKKFKLEKDFLDFLRLCNSHEVKYLVKESAGRPQDIADVWKLNERNKIK